MLRVVPLEMLRPGEQGRVCDVDGAAEFVHRLAEMGLREGAVVTMLQPGSPCILDLNQHRLSFRAEATAVVLVEITA